MSALITISNGTQFFRIPSSDLKAARSQGFYRPGEHDRTIVSNGREIFEIQKRDLKAALRDGFRDLLTKEAAAVTKMSAKATASANASAGPSVVQEFADAEGEFQEELEEYQREVESASGWRRLKAKLDLWWFLQKQGVLQQMRGTGVSVAVHVAIILLLASFLLASEDKEPAGLIVVAAAEEEVFEEEFIEPLDLEIEEPIEEEVEPVSEQPEVVTEITETVVSTDFTESLTGNMLAMPEPGGSKSDGSGDKADMKPKKAKVKFFGSKTEAVDFVFVIDNSNSMGGGRFETALNELIQAVMQLNAKQKFFVIFYSDTAYPLFHPYGAKTLVPATPKNKQLLVQWLKTVPLCLKTAGREALELGFNMKPDVMFVLGDGAFTDGASKLYASKPVKGVIVHTLGMEVKTAQAKSFEALAKAHNGTYRDVGVHPAGAEMARRFPRKKNNSRNGVWGLKLPGGKK